MTEAMRATKLTVMRRGDYGYDAPYFPLIFGFLSVGFGLGAAMSWWEGPGRVARLMTFYFVFCLANTVCFLYTTISASGPRRACPS